MKTNFFLLLVLILSLNSFLAQESTGIASVLSKADAVDIKNTGKLKITLPASSEKEEVDKSASYYVHNFSVNFDANSKVAELIMVTNDERSRQIIVRFLTACGVSQVNVGGTMVDLYPFYENYLK
jgi:hypothetical protein